MQINSTAIKNIGFGSDNEVTVTFTNDREYLYTCQDVDGFKNDLYDVIEEGESVGQFINRALKAQLLQTVWTYKGWVTQTPWELKLLTPRLS